MERKVKAQVFENFREHGSSVTEGPQGVPRVVRDSQVAPEWSFLCTLATDPPGQLDVPGHDGDPLGVDGAQVGVLKQSHNVSLAGLLKSHDGRALEPQVSLEVLGDLTDQTLEGQLADEQLSGLLVPRGEQD